MTLPRRGDRLAQAGDLVHEQGLPPLQQVDREEKAAARDERATIVRHGRQDSTFDLAVVEVETADYAHRAALARTGGLQSALRAQAAARLGFTSRSAGIFHAWLIL